MNYAPRISLPYNDVSGVIALWAGTCDRIAVYEHSQETQTSKDKTHIHMIMMGSKYKTPEQMKKIFYLHVKTDRKGNDLWEWTNKKWPNPDINFITYMSKGKLQPKFVKNISPAELEELRVKWIPPTPKGVKSSQQSLVNENDVKKSTKFQIIEKVVNLILAKHPLATTEEQRKDVLVGVSDTIVLYAIRRVLIEEHQVLGDYKIMDLYDGFIMYHNKAKYIDNLLMLIQKRQPRV